MMTHRSEHQRRTIDEKATITTPLDGEGWKAATPTALLQDLCKRLVPPDPLKHMHVAQHVHHPVFAAADFD